MKICSTCKRTYDDDTLAFCLDDGTRLSAAYSPGRAVDPDKTEILPAGLRPTEQSPSPPRETIAAPPPGYSFEAPRPVKRRAGKLWIVIGLLVLTLVGLIAVAGFFVWTANHKSSSDTPEISLITPLPTPSATPIAVPVKTSPSVQPEPTATPDLNWLDGVWQGEGYQTDTKTTWVIKLTGRGDTYSVEYPDIPCEGRWDLIDKNSRQATFTEVITQGTDRCGNNGGVMVEKVSASEISARFTHAGSRAVIATVVLSKKSQ